LLPQLSDPIKKKMSKSGQKVVKKLSNSCQKVVKTLSKSCQKVVKNGQKVVKVVKNFVATNKSQNKVNCPENNNKKKIIGIP
jgi:uncharacterized membrane-anchored protein YhcB (DUF1043 family)